MKRRDKIIGTLSLAIAISSAITPAYASIRNERVDTERFIMTPEYSIISTNSILEDKINYISFEGVVKEIEPMEGYTAVSLTDGSSDEIIGVFNILDKVMIVDQKTGEIIEASSLREGQKLTGYYRKDVYMIMIYPPRISPELVVVRDTEEKSLIKHSNFSEELISLDNLLKLNISEQTDIIDQYGEKCKIEDLFNQDLVVFYTTATKSIPAITNPIKIIVLKKQLDENELDLNEEVDEGNIKNEIAEIIKEDSYSKEGTLMIPLRKVAEHLGYEVTWNNKNRSILLKRGNVELAINIGKEIYEYNNGSEKFEQLPEIKDGKTYVPESFVERLLEL